ncbi:MAG: hypothetical protein ACFBSE_14380 [Prochloraceae cyanobacterium]
MQDKQRKEKFIDILNQLIAENDGVKLKLAQKLKIKPSTLTRWIQGQIDPISINLQNFVQIASVSHISTDELAKKLGISDRDKNAVINRFKSLVKDLLSKQSLEQLGNKLGVSHGAISGWISSQKNIDPRRIPIGTIVTLAEEKAWTIEQLLAYLSLKQIEEIQQDNFSKIQTSVLQLPLIERAKLLTWLSSDFEKQLSNQDQENFKENNLKRSVDIKIILVLEVENIATVSNYASNLVLHLNLKPENIKVTTTPDLPESIADIDILIFDISSPESASISLIEDIEFDRDIVVFANADLPSEVRSGLESKVTDVVVKPIDWQKLKDKAYFS